MARRILFGSYELLERIGEGGMAEVWRARSRGVAGFEKTVVIKRVLPSLMARKDFAKLLVREAKIAALLNHPNIVQIFELGEEEGAYYIAMEYVHGCDLATALTYKPSVADAEKTRSGLSLALRIWIAAEAAKALDYAHRRRAEDGRPLQIVHRDISPQNVLLGYEGQVKVADFGIALADQTGLGREEDPGVLRGKYAYMSPEQTRGESLDRRSDVFALGVVLHELLAGRRLFKGVDRADTLRRVREAEVPEIDLEAIGAPALLRQVVRSALAKDRENRYANAGAMAEDLSQVLVELDARVGPLELSEVLQQIAPRDDGARANKLRVDVVQRAGEDAVLSSVLATGPTPVALTDPTRAFPTSQRLRSERRPVLIVLADAEGSEGLIDLAAGMGGATLPPIEGVREAVFGPGDPEKIAGAAVRTALALKETGYPGAAVVATGDARLIGLGSDVAIDPLPETRERARTILKETEAGQVAVDPLLSDELHWRFHLDASTEWPRALGLRRRSERELGAQRQGPFVGRRSVLSRLAHALEKAGGGEGGALLLVGGSGLGKSRLLAEVRASLVPAKATFVLAHGAEAQNAPYAAFAELIGDLCGIDEEDSEQEKLAKTQRLRVLGLSHREVERARELVGLPHEVRERTGRPRGIELCVALRKALRALSSDGPVIVMLEDIQWMDEPTRQALDLLLAGLDQTRVLFILTSRPGAAIPHLNVDHVHIDPLRPAPSARVFAHRVGARALEGDRIDALHAQVGGNPAWLVFLAEALRDAGRLEITDGVVHGWGEGPLPLPQPMLARIAARVASLPDRDRNTFRSMAAFTTPVDLSTLAAVEGMPRDVAEGIVQRLLSARLVVPARGRLPPRHIGRWGGDEEFPLPATVCVAGGDLVRRAVFETVPERSRRGIHLRIADVLRQTGASGDERVEALAYHSAAAGDLERAPDELERAAALAFARDAPLVAARRWGDAARLCTRAGTDPERAAALALRAAEVALDAGDNQLAEEVLVLSPEVEDDALTLRRGLAEARLLSRREHWSEAARRVEALSDTLQRANDAGLRGRALVVLGEARLEAGDVEAAVGTLDDAVASLEYAGDRPRTGLAMCGLATALARAGESERAAHVGIQALVAAVRHGGPALRWRSLAAAAEIAEAGGDALTAYERWSEAARLARHLELDEPLARTGVRAGVAAFTAGLESQAAVWVEEAVRAGKRQGLEGVVSLGEAVRAGIALSAHPEAHFVKQMVRCVEHLESLGRLGDAALALQMLARAHLVLKDVGAAIRTLGRAAPLARAAGRPMLQERLVAEAERLAARGLDA